MHQYHRQILLFQKKILKFVIVFMNNLSLLKEMIAKAS